jgi:hypothetical protein
MKLPTLATISARTGLAKGWVVLILAIFAWLLVWALFNGLWAVVSLTVAG